MLNFISFLKQFSGLSEQTLSYVNTIFKEDSLQKGEFFVREGVYANEMAFLETGVVRAFYIDSKGNEYNKTLFFAPAIIGSYAALISKEKNKLPQQALTNCKIWRADFGIIERLSENNYEIERLRRKIAENFFVQNEKKQLEMALLEATDRYLILKNEHPDIDNLIPQYHIASYLGISPTQLSRIRQKLSEI